MSSDPALIALYEYPATQGRAWFRANFVSSIDGAATDADGVSRGLGGEADREVFAVLRSLCDVIVVGTGTAAAEKYQPVKENEVDDSLRKKLGLKPTPAIAVVSRNLHIPDALVVPGQLVITTTSAPLALREKLATTVEVIAAGETDIDWKLVREQLTVRGLTRVLCEGGPSINGQLIVNDALDELCLSIAPSLVAGNAPRIASSQHAVNHQMQLGHAIERDGVLFTRWVRNRAEPKSFA